MMRVGGRALVLLLLAVSAFPVAAQTRAWLDRDRIALGETTTLNIETDQAAAAAPDYSPLSGDFDVSGNTSTRQFEIVNGTARSRTLFAVALQPRREGLITIPGLVVGGQRTQSLTLAVSASTAAPAQAGSPVFIEAEADAQEPYVQQAVGYTVRLYYDAPLVSGQLDQDAPPGASLQRVGEDAQYVRDIGGHQYTVVERHYLLIPERSGMLAIPGARFRGKSAGGFFDDLLGDGERNLQASSAPRFLKVQPMPAGAPQPWLPLRALNLRYLDAPQRGRAGEAATVSVELTADGATAAQLPELQLSGGSDTQASASAQVFADPAQSDDRFSDGRPQVRMTRRFSIVPSQPGTLRIAGPHLRWWDVRAGIARDASLPDIVLSVAPAPHASPSSIAPDPTATGNEWVQVPGVQGRVQQWALATVVFAALWLVTLIWGLHRRAPAPADPKHAALPSRASLVQHQSLKRALDGGDLGDIADALCAGCDPPAVDLETVRSRLGDAQQVAAIDALQRARWGGAEVAAARSAIRQAFKRGPDWRTRDKTKTKDVLPPLYPHG